MCCLINYNCCWCCYFSSSSWANYKIKRTSITTILSFFFFLSWTTLSNVSFYFYFIDILIWYNKNLEEIWLKFLASQLTVLEANILNLLFSCSYLINLSWVVFVGCPSFCSSCHYLMQYFVSHKLHWRSLITLTSSNAVNQQLVRTCGIYNLPTHSSECNKYPNRISLVF